MLIPSPAERDYGEPIRALVDTCVMLDALGGNSGQDVLPARCVFQYLQTQGQLLHSPETLAEWDLIAKDPRTARRQVRTGVVSPEAASEELIRLKRGMTVIRPTEIFNLCRDRADNMWLELASASGAHAIITRDRDLLVLGHLKTCQILTPLAFLEQIAGCRPVRLAGVPVRGQLAHPVI
jgi:putative PIN family toxin of toxin-antitoxin system